MLNQWRQYLCSTGKDKTRQCHCPIHTLQDELDNDESGEEDNVKSEWEEESLFGEDDSNKDTDFCFSENAENEDEGEKIPVTSSACREANCWNIPQ